MHGIFAQEVWKIEKDVPYTDRADQLVHVYMDIMVSELLQYDHSYVII